MRAILLYTFLLFATNITYGGVDDKVIVPTTFNDLQNDTVKKEVLTIIEGNFGNYLRPYKTKLYRNTIINKYGNNGKWFYVHFSGEVISDKKKPLEINCGEFLLNDISYRHVKYMVILEKYSLSAINKVIADNFEGQNITCRAESFISEDNSRNYLRLSIANNIKNLELIFVIKNSQFYQCIKL